MSDKTPSQTLFAVNPLAASDQTIEQSLTPWLRYAIAIILPLVALGLGSLFSPWLQGGLFLPFFAAIGVVAWYCGFAPAMLSAVLSIFLVNFFLQEPRYQLTLGFTDLVRTATYILVALLINIPNIRRRRAEEVIRQQREWFRVTLDSIGDAVIATDTEQNITFINPVAARLCGWTEADALGKPVTEVFHILNEASRQTVENPVEKVLREGSIVGLANHTVLIRPDGGETPIDDSGAPIRNTEGIMIGTVLVFRDISERKVTEKQLQESEARFRTMAETVPGILFTMLSNRHVDYVSQKVTEYTGMSVEDALGLGYMSLLHPDDIERVQQAMPQSESTGSLAVEHRIRTLDGTYRWFFTRMRALFDDQGQIIKWVGKSTDIHDMKVAQEELTRLNNLLDQERARLSSILSTVPGVVWEAWGEPDEASQRINFVSDYVETMLGYTVDEWVSTPNFWLNIVHPDDKEQAGADSRQIFESGKPGINRFRWVTRDGRAIPVEAQSTVIFDDQGNPVGMRGVTMDISQREEAERERTLLIKAQQAAIREKDEALALLDALFSSAPVGLAFFDRDLRFQRINQALADINGLSPEAHIGRTPRELLPDVAIEGTETMFQQVLESGRMVIFETSGRTLATSGDETNYWLACYYPIRLGDELLGIGALVMDITDRKRIEQQKANLLERERAARKAAEEADRLKLTFLAMISHELRTPLTSIKGFATTLLADDITWDAESQRDFIAIISEESDKLTDLIEQLLDLSRLEAGTMSITPESMPLSEIISTAMAQLETITVNHTLQFDVAADLPPVMADVRRAGQIITNLVNNAAKYTPVGSQIQVRAVRDDGFLLVSITDDGPGIPPEERALVFEAFRQVESKGSNYKKGAGLGLAICKGLAEAHGGRIWIEDTTSGTTICFTLPVAE